MRKSLTETVSESQTLAPFIRHGLEGPCLECLKPITAHIDARGQWIGCQSKNAPDVPFMLVPARRKTDFTSTLTLKPDGNGHDRRVNTPPPTPKAAPKEVVKVSVSQPRAITGPQVTYVARFALDNPAIDRLPPHDRKVYGLIARARTNGATRATLLDHLGAHKHTGRVDGAVRRLRLRKVIKVVAVS